MPWGGELCFSLSICPFVKAASQVLGAWLYQVRIRLLVLQEIPSSARRREELSFQMLPVASRAAGDLSPEGGITLLPTSNALLPVTWQGLLRPGGDDMSRWGRGPVLWAAFLPTHTPFSFPAGNSTQVNGLAQVSAKSHLSTACLDQRRVESRAGSLSCSPVGPRGPHKPPPLASVWGRADNRGSFCFIIALCLFSRYRKRQDISSPQNLINRFLFLFKALPHRIFWYFLKPLRGFSLSCAFFRWL